MNAEGISISFLLRSRGRTEFHRKEKQNEEEFLLIAVIKSLQQLLNYKDLQNVNDFSWIIHYFLINSFYPTSSPSVLKLSMVWVNTNLWIRRKKIYYCYFNCEYTDCLNYYIYHSNSDNFKPSRVSVAYFSSPIIHLIILFLFLLFFFFVCETY